MRNFRLLEATQACDINNFNAAINEGLTLTTSTLQHLRETANPMVVEIHVCISQFSLIAFQ